MSEAQRLDKWLWFARFAKSRTLAARLCAEGRVRVNRVAAGKPSATVRPGDVLTFPQGPHIRVVRILQSGARRGPAEEARMLYEDLAPPAPREPQPPQAAERDRGAGRPTKRDRRAIDRLTDSEGDEA
jgi:ribosome-associated heat shock protein Hsp15